MKKQKKKNGLKWFGIGAAVTAASVAAVYYSNRRPYTEYEEKDVRFLSERETMIPATITIPKTHRKMPLVLFVHGFGAERTEGERFTQIAHRLAARGIASIRLDFAGCGASKESYREYCISHNLSDMKSALAYMEKKYRIDEEHIGMVGYSMGGRQTILYTEMDARIHTIALFAPALTRGFSKMEEFMGGSAKIAAYQQEAEQNGFVNFPDLFGGNKQLGSQYFIDMLAYDPIEALENYSHRLFYVQGNADTTVTPEVAGEALQHVNPQATLHYLYMDHANHGFGLWDNHPEQSEKLVKSTASFLLRYL